MISGRKEQIAREMQEAGIGALVCALPKNVLMLSGYWPVVGTGMAIASSDGIVRLIVPEDEKEFARFSGATDIETFTPGSLEQITTAAEQIKQPLAHVLRQLRDYEHLNIGYEQGCYTQPSSYAAMHLYQGKLSEVIRDALPTAQLVSADGLLSKLRSYKTEQEIAAIERACRLSQTAFEDAGEILRAGVSELEAAYELRKRFAVAVAQQQDIRRAEAFFFVMSGKNSAKAHGAFAYSTAKRIENGDLVLVHCNTFVDGYCTDVTRTFSLGEVDDKRQAIYDAVFAAREDALAATKSGVPASAVDNAARNLLTSRGFGKEFKHSTGHGVGFGAISPDARPRLHPMSQDVLEPGMVFNIEPAVYIEEYGGIRHCDMVAITENGSKLLTPFLSSKQDVILTAARKAHA